MMPVDQETYWRESGYRGPHHPVVEAYVRPKLDRVESVLPLAGKSILDVGCGPGLFTHHLKQRAGEGRVVGSDVSAWMVEQARNARVPAGKGVGVLEVVQADASALPFADGSFDVVFEANLLHHVADPAAVVREMARVASAAVVILEVNRLNPVMFLFSLVNPAERGGLRSSRQFLRGLLADAGLAEERFWTTGMISQNNTPGFMVPLLRIFDVDFAFGEYHLCVARKRSAP